VLVGEGRTGPREGARSASSNDPVLPMALRAGSPAMPQVVAQVDSREAPQAPALVDSLALWQARGPDDPCVGGCAADAPRALEERKVKLAKVLSRAQHGIYFSEHLDDDGELIFKHACRMGLEGIVSKRRDFPYRSGRTKSWIKIKNPASPARLRVQDGTF
jgi:hypothetical protein